MLPGAKRLFELADEVMPVHVEVLCWCGRPGRLNARVVDGRWSARVTRWSSPTRASDRRRTSPAAPAPVVHYQVLCRLHHRRGDLGRTTTPRSAQPRRLSAAGLADRRPYRAAGRDHRAGGNRPRGQARHLTVRSAAVSDRGVGGVGTRPRRSTSRRAPRPRSTEASVPSADAPASRTAAIRASQVTRCAVAVSRPSTRTDATGCGQESSPIADAAGPHSEPTRRASGRLPRVSGRTEPNRGHERHCWSRRETDARTAGRLLGLGWHRAETAASD